MRRADRLVPYVHPARQTSMMMMRRPSGQQVHLPSACPDSARINLDIPPSSSMASSSPPNPTAPSSPPHAPLSPPHTAATTQSHAGGVGGLVSPFRCSPRPRSGLVAQVEVLATHDTRRPQAKRSSGRDVVVVAGRGPVTIYEELLKRDGGWVEGEALRGGVYGTQG